MKKTEIWVKELITLLSAYLESGNSGEVADYLTSHSSLPGPRANLELAFAFGKLIGEQWIAHNNRLLGLCQDFLSIPPDEAPVNDPQEFLPFCGAIGIGAIGAVDNASRDSVLENLRQTANDLRWRIREAACFGLQYLLAVDADAMLKSLEHWIAQGTLLEARAAVVAVAEPRLLQQTSFAQQALGLQELAMNRVQSVDDRRSDSFIVFRKALAFTLSVVVVALPGNGFDMLQRLAVSGDKDLVWVLRQNLKKKRLIAADEERVTTLLSQLNG